MNKISLFLLLFITTVVTVSCTPSTPLSPTSTPTALPRVPIGPTSASSGLSELQSYRTHLTIDFKGSRSDESAEGHIETSTELTRQPPALRHYLKLEGDLPKANIGPGTSEFFRLNEQIHLKKADDDSWSQFTAANVSPGQLGFPELEQLMILPVTVSHPPRLETLNGLNVEHYAFSKNDLTDPNTIFDMAQGEVWVATNGHFVVQYVISASMRITSPHPKAHIFDEGTMKLHYTLTDINADFSISPPANVVIKDNPLDHLPRLPDAEIISIFPTLIEYTSAIRPISATLFYQDELSTLEWTEDHTTIFNEKARLTFSKDDQILTIIITPTADDDKIKVLLDIK